MFKRCGAAMLLFPPLGMLVLGILLVLFAPRFIAQWPHHHRDHGRERRLLEQRNNDAAVR